MRKLFSLKYHAVNFMLVHLYLLALISTTLGSFDTVSEAKCEYEDANLIWRNTPTYSVSDVKAMAWYKGKGSLIATWLDGKGFVEYPPYIGRLMQIGETGIKIRTVNRSDSGTYWLSLTLASVEHKLEAETHLEVIVAPSQCKPRITRTGSILKAELPSEGCGTPHLTTKWKHTVGTVNQENSPSLDIGSNPMPGEYMVCAEGESAKCYRGNISDLCTALTLLQPGQSDDGLTRVILPCVLVPVIILIALVIGFKRGLIGKQCCKNNRDAREMEGSIEMEEFETMDTDNDEECPFFDKGETASIGLFEIQNYLRRLYKNMTHVSVSPAGKGSNVDVSEVYIDLDFQQMETRNIKDIKTVSATSHDTLDYDSVKARTIQCSPVVVVGESGSGKSTWCKHLVQCWSRKSKLTNTNIHGLDSADFEKCRVLLYLPLTYSERGLNFHELLERTLFKKQPAYLGFIKTCIYDESQPQSIVIIIDGLDKVGENVKPILKFLDQKLLSACTVIFTSRPSSLNFVFDACADSSIQMKVSKICEMTQEKVKAYVSNVLKITNRQDDEDFNIDNFFSFTNYLHVQCLLQLPYLCLILLIVWRKNKNFFIEISDIMLDVLENILCRAMTDQRCKENIIKVSQENSYDVPTNVKKLCKRPFLLKHIYILHAHSMIADEIYAIQNLSNKDRLPETSILRNDTLFFEVIYEMGLVSESLALDPEENISKLTFTNVMLYEFFVSMAIAFKKGHAFDHIASSPAVAQKNSRIIHMLWQLSPDLGKNIFVRISNLREEKTKIHDKKNRLSDANRRPRYFIADESMFRTKEFTWLQSVLYKDDLDNDKLLFLTNSIRSIDSLTTLVLENANSNENLVFWLPLSNTLKKLVLNINKCTLQLCQEWNHPTPSKLEEMVMKSVNINASTLGLLVHSLNLCENLQVLEMTPIVVRTDDTEHLTEKSNHGKYWVQLSESIIKIKKLKTLKLGNLSLVGAVDNLLFRVKQCSNLETLELKNLIGTLEKKIPESYSARPLGVTNDDEDDKNVLVSMNLSRLVLENVKLQHRPLDFLFNIQNKTNKARPIKNDLKVLRLAEIEMPAEDDWRTLGDQIRSLNPCELHLRNIDPRGFMQIFVNGICKCKGLMTLSVNNRDIIENALQDMSKLSELRLEQMTIDGSYLQTLIKQINKCKELKTLSLCNIAIQQLPQEICTPRNLRKLSIDNVTTTEGSLCDFLVGICWCTNLKTLSLRNIKETEEEIRSKLLAHKEIKCKIYIK